MIFDLLATAWFRLIGGTPAFRVYGRSRHEQAWRIISVYATHRRSMNSRWPAGFFRGTCICWTSKVIAIGNDIAEEILREQSQTPASQDHPVEVLGGRLRDPARRTQAGGPAFARASELLAHEIGHTGQARRFDVLYLIFGAMFTLCREGERWCNWFENQASADGQFGGVVNGSVRADLLNCLQRPTS